MATETTVLVTCDRCGEEHYHGPADDRPEHVRMTLWGGICLDWKPADLCESCAGDLAKHLREFGEDVPEKRVPFEERPDGG